MTLGTSSWDTTVDSFFDDALARIRHLYSSGAGSGGLPSRGLGRSIPSSAFGHRVHIWDELKIKMIVLRFAIVSKVVSMGRYTHIA